MYGLLRKLASHAETFYGAVGIFMIAGIVIAVLATLGFSELAERVLKG
ncbi:MAG: hypothetical protein JWM95_1772, partial [Gemmatimonadetes bacterium]|nr:hypothetical protein [Gemmatimonadota bacterium]